jgi:hypothetical protein
MRSERNGRPRLSYMVAAFLCGSTLGTVAAEAKHHPATPAHAADTRRSAPAPKHELGAGAGPDEAKWMDGPDAALGPP